MNAHPPTPNIYPVIILGAGPAGLSMAYNLLRRGIAPLVLEKGATVGHSFSKFAKSCYFGPWINNLLPGSSTHWTRLLQRSSQPAYYQYLQDFCYHNHLPVQCGVEVTSINKERDYFVVQTSKGRYCAHLLVNCTGYFSRPYTPYYPGLKNTSIPYMHVSQYQDPSNVTTRLNSPSGKLLIVGKRLSAGETLVELHKAGYQVAISHRGNKLEFGPSSTGEAILSPLNYLIEQLYVALRVKKVFYPPMAGGESQHLIRTGAVRTFPNISKFTDNTVVFQNGQQENFDLIVFATGYRAAVSHLESLLGPQPDEPELKNMESAQVPGLFFLGLDQQRSYRSRFLRGIIEDSQLLAELVARRASRLTMPRNIVNKPTRYSESSPTLVN